MGSCHARVTKTLTEEQSSHLSLWDNGQREINTSDILDPTAFIKSKVQRTIDCRLLHIGAWHPSPSRRLLHRAEHRFLLLKEYLSPRSGFGQLQPDISIWEWAPMSIRKSRIVHLKILNYLSKRFFRYVTLPPRRRCQLSIIGFVPKISWPNRVHFSVSSTGYWQTGCLCWEVVESWVGIELKSNFASKMIPLSSCLFRLLIT